MDKIDRFFVILNITILIFINCCQSRTLNSLKDQLDQIRLLVKPESATQSLSTGSSTTTTSDTIALPLGGY